MPHERGYSAQIIDRVRDLLAQRGEPKLAQGQLPKDGVMKIHIS
jgi:hypothetical protein